MGDAKPYMSLRSCWAGAVPPVQAGDPDGNLGGHKQVWYALVHGAACAGGKASAAERQDSGTRDRPVSRSEGWVLLDVDC